MRLILAALTALVALVTTPAPAHAHTRSVSYSAWTMRADGARVSIKLSALDQSAAQAAAAMISGDPSPARYLQANLGLVSASGPCPAAPASFNELTATAGWFRYEWEIRCADTSELRIHSDVLFDVVPAHIHFARVDVDGVRNERVLTEGTRDAELAAIQGGDEAALAITGRYVGIGIDHILSGWDHLVFLLTLIIIARRLREVAIAVTGFTLGHSVTLALAALGYATPVAGTVEALIGLSIALVAVENVWLSGGRRSPHLPIAAIVGVALCALFAALWGTTSATAIIGLGLFAACYYGILARARRPIRLRCAVAAVFGLIHGFGFAGALQELALDAHQLALPLLGFNLGVELGQLAVLALVWPLLALARRLGRERELVLVEWGSAITLGLGLFWFVSRA